MLKVGFLIGLLDNNFYLGKTGITVTLEGWQSSTKKVLYIFSPSLGHKSHGGGSLILHSHALPLPKIQLSRCCAGERDGERERGRRAGSNAVPARTLPPLFPSSPDQTRQFTLPMGARGPFSKMPTATEPSRGGGRPTATEPARNSDRLKSISSK